MNSQHSNSPKTQDDTDRSTQKFTGKSPVVQSHYKMDSFNFSFILLNLINKFSIRLIVQVLHIPVKINNLTFKVLETPCTKTPLPRYQMNKQPKKRGYFGGPIFIKTNRDHLGSHITQGRDRHLTSNQFGRESQSHGVTDSK